MNVKISVILLLVLASAIPSSANNRKNQLEKGMLEKMDAVPCGAKQRGLSGLGSLWASVGITHVNSDEKRCPQYLLRTDAMDYEIRPVDLKHARILPVGTEGEFKIKKNVMVLSMEEGGDRKMREYEVVSMNPNNPDNDRGKSSSLTPGER
jgi:hypothetical protein